MIESKKRNMFQPKHVGKPRYFYGNTKQITSHKLTLF